MNGKKAKLLRQDAKAKTRGLVNSVYEKVNVQTKFFDAGIGADGLPQRIPYQTYTSVLGACTRSVYKTFKGIYKRSKGTLKKSVA